MHLHRVLAGCLLLAITMGADAAWAGILIKVDKTTQRMSVSVDGKVRHSWAVSTGMSGYSTPIGFYAPSHLAKDHRSREWDDQSPPMWSRCCARTLQRKLSS
jgi:lipoprotein-anchoring transpeptidase ErfK/SrfK